MKYQIKFSEKIRKMFQKCRLLKFLPSMLLSVCPGMYIYNCSFKGTLGEYNLNKFPETKVDLSAAENKAVDNEYRISVTSCNAEVDYKKVNTSLAILT